MGNLVVEVLFKGRLLRTVAFDGPALRIGRMRENDVVIDNLSVSRFHARLQLAGGHVFLEDNGSENGCFVNDQRVRGRLELRPGDVIGIGKHQLRVRSALEGETTAAAATRREPGRSDPWDAMQTYLAGPDTRAQLRGASAATPPAPSPEEPEPMRTDSDRAPLGGRAAAEGEPVAASGLHAGLIVQRDGRIERIVPWEGDSMVLGRASDCDLVLPQEEVSRRHARLVRQGPRYEIQDLGSVNGTLVNGRRIDRHVLAVGDVIAIESFQLTFVLDREPIAGLMKPAPAPIASEHDSRAMTILQEEMIPIDPLPSAPQPPDGYPDDAAELLPEVDLLSEPLDPELDERKDQAARNPRTSSRASAVQDLGRAEEEASSHAVVLELRLRLEALPEPLRRALAELEVEGGIPLEAEVRLRAPE